mmetsp:Transcript_33028/g.78888  ORF Transcript_33028/g.78888 Transcript_33028/m.78888 type:complete len:96 (+) Transcript_33028:2596-2883(+)
MFTLDEATPKEAKSCGGVTSGPSSTSVEELVKLLLWFWRRKCGKTTKWNKYTGIASRLLSREILRLTFVPSSSFDPLIIQDGELVERKMMVHESI